MFARAPHKSITQVLLECNSCGTKFGSRKKVDRLTPEELAVGKVEETSLYIQILQDFVKIGRHVGKAHPP